MPPRQAPEMTTDQRKPNAHAHVIVEVEHFDSALGMVLDRLANVEGSQLKAEDVAAAVGKGIEQAFANPATWCGAGDGLRKAAEAQAGPWLIKMMVRWLARMLFFAVAGVFIYQFGGWTALAASWKALGGPP